MGSAAKALTLEEAKQVMEVLKEGKKQHFADVALFLTSQCVRISDALAVKMVDVKDGVWHLVESKTGKTKPMKLRDSVVDMISRRMKEHPDAVFLFENTYHEKYKGKPLRRESCSVAFGAAGKQLGMEGVSAHSFRKAMGRFCYQASGNNIAAAMKVLNHTSPAATLAYISETDAELDSLLAMADI